MNKILMLALTLASPIAAFAEIEQQGRPWTVYTHLDLFAYSEPVSIAEFARDFQDDLEEGETSFTQDSFELGLGRNNWRIAFVQRFDYITEFTEDIALIHHSEKNGRPIDETREYDLEFEVERVHAKGLKLGYTWNVKENFRFDIALAWYPVISDLQSGRAVTFGDLEPITPELIDEINALAGDLTADSRDLSPLYDLIRDIDARILIDYAYDEPAFDEPVYRTPVIVGGPNPVIGGVDFSAPDGSGYALDLGGFWRINDRLSFQLRLIDVVNEFKWDNAPQTLAVFDLYPFLHDAIGVAQQFVDGEVVRPNDLVDRHLLVAIENEDYTQRLPWRADVDVEYSLDNEIDIRGWTPHLSLLAGFYRAGNKNFPRLGMGFDKLRVEYDFGAEAISLGYSHRYFFFRLITDTLDFEEANTLGIAAGFNLSIR